MNPIVPMSDQPESRKVSSYFNSQPQKDKPNEDQVHLVYDRQNAEADGIYVLEMDSLFSSS